MTPIKIIRKSTSKPPTTGAVRLTMTFQELVGAVQGINLLPSGRVAVYVDTWALAAFSAGGQDAIRLEIAARPAGWTP